MSRYLLLLILLLYETAVLEQWVHIIVAHTPDRGVACRHKSSSSDDSFSPPAPNRCRCDDKCPIFIAVMVVGISAVMPPHFSSDNPLAAARTAPVHLLVPFQENVGLFYQRAPPVI